MLSPSPPFITSTLQQAASTRLGFAAQRTMRAAQALYEVAIYDDQAQITNPSLMDYLVPSAAEMPSIKLDSTVTPSTSNPLGVKGVGEAGTIGPAAAVINAVCDALSPHGITDIEMPATPWRVRRAIEAAGGGS